MTFDLLGQLFLRLLREPAAVDVVQAGLHPEQGPVSEPLLAAARVEGPIVVHVAEGGAREGIVEE